MGKLARLARRPRRKSAGHGRRFVVHQSGANPPEHVAGRCADALLLKVNQIGTLTEAAQSLRLARDAGWQVMISARSGETEDDWLADLAAGWSADQIKIGSITQSERLSKYNRLLELEAETALKLIPQ